MGQTVLIILLCLSVLANVFLLTAMQIFRSSATEWKENCYAWRWLYGELKERTSEIRQDAFPTEFSEAMSKLNSEE